MLNRNIFLPALILFNCVTAWSQDSTLFRQIPLESLQAFRHAGKNWVVAGDATASLNEPQNLRAEKGSGILVNTMNKNNQMHLITNEEYGDVEVELDFMMAKSSNSGVYLQGRYEIQLMDSWTKTHPAYSDVGGIYARFNESTGIAWGGAAPNMNVSKAPGLWQHLSIRFKAPKFSSDGAKIENARFEDVFLNGVLIHQNVVVTGPTRASLFQDEKPYGPLMIQGDHGSVAVRNLRIRQLLPGEADPDRKKEWWVLKVNPIFVNPAGETKFIKSFMNFADRKLTHIISIGHPNQASYSYDLKRGAVFQLWRGDFMDITRAWYGRGESQLGVPLGAVIPLSDAPTVSILDNPDSKWPDSVEFDDVINHGYVLNQVRSPTFHYTLKGLDVYDSILFVPGGTGLTRSISITNPSDQVYVRLATGKKVDAIGDGLYSVDDKTYYIQVDKKFNPIVRTSGKTQEVLVNYSKSGPVTYSIIW